MINTKSNEYLNFKKIKSQADIHLILGELNLLDDLTDKGDELVGWCPLGKDQHGKANSFSFNTEKKAFQCFSCKKSGSILDFFVFYEQKNGEHDCSLRDAALWVQSAMNNQPQRPIPTQKEENTSNYVVNDENNLKTASKVSEQPYLTHNEEDSSDIDDKIIDTALNVLKKRLIRGDVFSNPSDVKNFLQLKLAPLKHERLAILLLDNKHQLIAMEDLSNGSPSESKVSCNYLLRVTIKHGAAAVILAHNHPSGNTEPSQQDNAITENIKTALEYIQVRLLDHIVVGKNTYSFAEHGLI